MEDKEQIETMREEGRVKMREKEEEGIVLGREGGNNLGGCRWKGRRCS